MARTSELCFGDDLIKSLQDKGIVVPKRIKSIHVNINEGEAVELIYRTIPDAETLDAIMAFLVERRLKVG